jgi:hypothetical protein
MPGSVAPPAAAPLPAVRSRGEHRAARAARAMTVGRAAADLARVSAFRYLPAPKSCRVKV